MVYQKQLTRRDSREDKHGHESKRPSRELKTGAAAPAAAAVVAAGGETKSDLHLPGSAGGADVEPAVVLFHASDDDEPSHAAAAAGAGAAVPPAASLVYSASPLSSATPPPLTTAALEAAFKASPVLAATLLEQQARPIVKVRSESGFRVEC